MTLKKWKVISVVGIFLFSALLHFIYDWFPNFFTSLFFPVNESIGEHNKIIVGSFLFWAIIISQIVSYKLLQKEYYSKLEELGIILFVIFFLINIIFTYYPPKVALFYDYTNKIYGLK